MMYFWNFRVTFNCISTYIKESILINTFLIFSLSSNCQIDKSLPHSSYAEKIYLQVDNNIYTNNQTIWFKTIVTDAVDHVPAPLSSVLYVELISPSKSIVEQKRIKLTNGIGSGFFQLDEGMETGTYLIRSYTQWNKNFGEDFIFRQYIKVFSSEANHSEEPISDIVLHINEKSEKIIKGTLTPFTKDRADIKTVKLFLTIDGKLDSLEIKRNKNGTFDLEYPISKEDNIVTMSYKPNNAPAFSKTLTLNKHQIDLQFFPEGGELIDGLRSTVGFKALGSNGKGKEIQGEIVDENHNILTTFKSNKLGMGHFIVIPDKDREYFVRIKSDNNGESVKLYALPEIRLKGIQLAVNKHSNRVFLSAKSKHYKSDSIYFQIKQRGSPLYNIDAKLDNGSFTTAIPSGNLPNGIISITLFNSYKQPIAERLIFNENELYELDIDVRMNRSEYVQREKTQLRIEVSDVTGIVQSNLSVKVINKEQLGEFQQQLQNIESWFLLDSELRGNIEQPGYYFSDKGTKYNEIDDLLLTQGWRKYVYDKPKDSLIYPPEQSLLVTGKITSPFSKKSLKEGVELTMLAYSNPVSMQNQKTDSLGRFYFNVNDKFGQEMNILIQTKNEKGKNKEYNIELDQKLSPEINYDQYQSVEEVDTIIYSLVDENRKRKKIEESFRLSDETTYLDEVTIDDYKLTPERAEVVEKYGMPEVVIDGDNIREKEQVWSTGLFSVLAFNFPDDIEIWKTRGGEYAYVRGNDLGTVVLVDGEVVKYYDRQLIPRIPPEDVKSVEVIRNAKNFMQAFLEMWPGTPAASAPPYGNIISIHTFAGKGVHAAQKIPGMLNTYIPVYSPNRMFYSPKYEDASNINWAKPDYRALVHWDPIIETDNKGIALSSFYNADLTGKMIVIIEVITSDGTVGLKQLEYEVIKRKKK